MSLPGHILPLIFDFIPHVTWCLNRSRASKIVEIGKQWKQLSNDFQCILFSCKHELFPCTRRQEHYFNEATRILGDALNLCSVPFHCHAFVACRLIERSIFLDSFYDFSKTLAILGHNQNTGTSTIDVSNYVRLQRELQEYLMEHKKRIWKKRVIDRLNNLYCTGRLMKYKTTIRWMKWCKIHRELLTRTPLSQ